MIAKYLLRNSFDFGSAQRKNRFTDHLDYSLTANGLMLVNWFHDDKVNQVSAVQNLKYQYSFQNERCLKLSGTFVHNLGFQYYFDSLARVNIDDNNLSAKLDIKIEGIIFFTISSVISSRLLNGFDYLKNDSGMQIRLLNSSFLTPLIWNLSLGIGCVWKNFGSANLGISSGKLTSILNKQIFAIRGINNFYGIEQGKSHLLEYGITFQLLIDKDIFRIIHWDCDLLLFKNYDSPPDLSFKNLFGFRVNRFLKASFQTRICYEEKLCKHVQFQNLLSVGLNFQL